MKSHSNQWYTCINRQLIPFSSYLIFSPNSQDLMEDYRSMKHANTGDWHLSGTCSFSFGIRGFCSWWQFTIRILNCSVCSLRFSIKCFLFTLILKCLSDSESVIVWLGFLFTVWFFCIQSIQPTNEILFQMKKKYISVNEWGFSVTNISQSIILLSVLFQLGMHIMCIEAIRRIIRGKLIMIQPCRM